MAVKREDFPKFMLPGLFEGSDQRIMIFHEKHGDAYFMARTAQEACDVCLNILTERYNEDDPAWYSASVGMDEARERLDKLTPPDHEEDCIDMLPTCLHEEFKAKWDTHRKEKGRYEESIAWYTTVRSTIELKDAALAYKIMHSRRDYEYEGFEFVDPEVVSDERAAATA